MAIIVQLLGLFFLVTGFFLGKDLWDRDEPIWPSLIFAGPGLFMIAACYVRYGKSKISKIIFWVFLWISIVGSGAAIIFCTQLNPKPN